MSQASEPIHDKSATTYQEVQRGINSLTYIQHTLCQTERIGKHFVDSEQAFDHQIVQDDGHVTQEDLKTTPNFHRLSHQRRGKSSKEKQIDLNAEIEKNVVLNKFWHERDEELEKFCFDWDT